MASFTLSRSNLTVRNLRLDDSRMQTVVAPLDVMPVLSRSPSTEGGSHSLLTVELRFIGGRMQALNIVVFQHDPRLAHAPASTLSLHYHSVHVAGSPEGLG